MRGRIAALAFGAALGAGTAAAQEDFVPAPGFDGAELTFDNELGRHSRLTLDDACGVNSIRARVQVIDVERGQRWAPPASIAAFSGQDVASVQLMVRRRWHRRMENYDMSRLREPAFTLTLWVRNGQGYDMEEFSTPVALGEIVEVTFAWTPDGEVIARSRGEERRVRMARPPTGVDLYSYNGQAHFSDLRIGRSGAPTDPCGASATAADGFVAAPALSAMRLDLDTHDGADGRLALKNVCAVNAIRGVLRPSRAGRGAAAIATVEILLQGDAGSVAFALRGDAAEGPMSIALASEGTRAEFARTLPQREGTPFALDWSVEGVVRARVGDETQSLGSIGAVRTITISNASGEAEFEELAFGSTGAADCAADGE